MRRIIRIIFGIVVLTGFSSGIQKVYGQEANSLSDDQVLNKTVGKWNGTLVVEGTNIPLVFKVLKDGKNILRVTLDSPLQNAYDIPLGDITNNSGEVKIDAPMLQGNYSGRFVNDTTLNGIWHQAGISFPLNLEKNENR